MKLNQIANNPGAHKRKDKLGRRSTLEDTPAVRGMVAKVAHLVVVE